MGKQLCSASVLGIVATAKLFESNLICTCHDDVPLFAFGNIVAYYLSNKSDFFHDIVACCVKSISIYNNSITVKRSVILWNKTGFPLGLLNPRVRSSAWEAGHQLGLKIAVDLFFVGRTDKVETMAGPRKI